MNEKPASNDKPDSPAAIDTPKVLDELSRKNTASPSAKTRRQRLRVFLILLLLTPLLLGLAFTAYQQWQVQLRLASLEDENARLATQQTSSETELLDLVTRLNQQMGDLAARSGVDEAALSRMQEQLQQEFSRELETVDLALQSLQRQQISLQNRDANSLFIEAGFLLRMASRKLQLDQDMDSAGLLLNQVLDTVRGIETPAATALRNNVEEDLRRLQGTRRVDIPAIHAQLAALAADVAQLSLVTSLQDAYQEQLGQSWQRNNPADSGINAVDAGLALLGSIFVWREWEEVPSHMLPPQQEYYVREQMRLLLEQARLAVLMRQESLFRDLLSESKAWMTRYQLQDTEQGRAMIQQIDALMQLPLVQQVPEITSTVN
ncbi:MAG: uroporphyrinogen-III C-methyltransferase [Pseudomonadales bacterium]|nr:uroporphyrinogen-III C-methyltransferase [Pseudomonadales bacterium]